MVKTSEQINELSEALAKAQAKFGAAIKSSANPAFRSKYADLSSVIDATLEHLNSEGITVMQHPALTFEERGEQRLALVTMTTRLQHKSGQWMESDLSIPAVQRDRFDAQSVGSAITYAARYALQSICVVPREDDDGNAASGVGTKDAAQDVGQRKVKEAKERQAARQKSDTLFYTLPESHNGHYAEFLNIPAFIADNQDKEDSLRMVFTAHKAKKTAGDTHLVPAEQMTSLLEKLAGDCGVSVHQLKAAQ